MTKTKQARRSKPVGKRKIRPTHELIIALIKDYGSMTDYELRDHIEKAGYRISFSGVSARRSELCPPRGYGLRDSGKTRLTPNDRPATVWELDPYRMPCVLPSKIRNLRPTQRQVYQIFVDKKGDGIESMSHAQLWHEYDRLATEQRPGWETTLSESGVRSRCAELVDLGLVKRFPDSVIDDKGKIAMWGLA